MLIAEARLELAPGLNVITGETGAGKTLLTQGIGLLLGQKGEESLVRPGCEQALVQAVFDDDGETHLGGAPHHPQAGARAPFSTASCRRCPRSRRRCASGSPFTGSSSTPACCSSTASSTCSTPGQAPSVAALLADYGAAWATLQALSRELVALRGEGRDRDHEVDLLRFQIGEIEAAAVEPGEDERLKVERERLRHAEKLVERVGGAAALLSDESSGGGLDALRTAERLLAEAESLDPALADAAARLAALAAEADDVLAVLRDYLDDLDVDPAHRDAVELRYDQIRLLARKYGGSADAIIAYAAAASERLVVLERLVADESDLVARLEAAQARARRHWPPGSRRRAPRPRPSLRRGSPTNCAAWPCRTCASKSCCRPRERRLEGLGQRGADEAEFVFSANPGVPPRPLRETASGGELSRAMLAIKSLVHLGHDVRTLIFDEVDTGIGGVTATRPRRAPGGARRRHPDRLHHPPAPGGGVRRTPLRDPQARRPRRPTPPRRS